MTKEHWENIYRTKSDDQVSWTQILPNTALSYLSNLSLPRDAKIIEVGGGASNLADALLDLGYTDITVLDISQAALVRSQERLGANADKVKWIVTDILAFAPVEKYDFWYDRAVFHFLTMDQDQVNYVDLVSQNVVRDGHLLLGTFSDQGPLKCSGLEVSRYSDRQLTDRFCPQFKMQECFKEMHKTPFDTHQEFQFCGFKKC